MVSEDEELIKVDQLREEVRNCRAMGEYYRNILESADKGTWVINDGGETVYINYRMAEMLGHTTREVIGQNIYDFIDTEHRSQFSSRLNGCEADCCDSFDLKLRRRNGNDLWALAGLRPLFDKTGKNIGVNGTFVDITERKHAEDARKKLLHTLGERVKELTALYGVSNIVQASASTEEILQKIALMLPPAWQYPESAVSRITYGGMSLTSQGFRESPWAQRADFTTADINGTIEVYYTEEKPPEVEGPFLAEERKLIDSIAEIVKTFLERRQAEEARRESEEKFRTLAETAPVAIFFHGGDNFIYANPAALKMVDKSFNNLSNTKFWDLFDKESGELVKERGLARLQGETPPQRYEVKLRTGDGEKWMDITSSRLMYKGTMAILTVGLDITQNKKAEIALREAKANADLYVDLMCHDIRNMNQVGLGFLELALDLLTLDDSGRELLLKSKSAFENSSKLIDNVKKLKTEKMGLYEPRVLDLGDVLEDVCRRFEKVPDRYVKIHCAAVKGMKVQANELLPDVFANIVENGIKHSKGPAIIKIRMNFSQADGKKYYAALVEDNGPGIPDELKNIIFDRKLVGDIKTKGNGIGLYLVKSLVESYGGRVWVEDRVKGDHTKGAKFIVTLPAVDN